jgi:hypothetical protein
MGMSAVLREADLYKRFLGRFVATAAVGVVALDLLSAIADGRSAVGVDPAPATAQ